MSTRRSNTPQRPHRDFSWADSLLRDRHLRTASPNSAGNSGRVTSTSSASEATTAGSVSTRSTFGAATDRNRGDNQQPQGCDPPYAKLCNSVSCGPLSQHLMLQPPRDAGVEVHNFLRNLLNENPNFDGDPDAIIDSRMQDAHLLLDSRPAKGLRKHGQKSRRSGRRLSMHQHRLLGSYALPEEARQYKVYLELHKMWKEYAADVIEQCKGNEAMIHSRLLTADLHGAVLAVVERKDPTLVGNQGIMVRETVKTFGLVTSQNKFAIIPKEGSVFKLMAKNLILTLFGSNLGIREVGS